MIFDVGLREDRDERGFAYLGKANYSSFHVFMSLLEDRRGSEREDWGLAIECSGMPPLPLFCANSSNEVS